ncbi:hypothetical protein F5B18DRAFT_121534 [Nemania serpens]|nr:hypothetical protein F5B18DRAFT_121534 [Nemania serpens]
MAEAGFGFGTQIFARLYEKGKNYKGDIQTSHARLRELRETLNDNRKYLDRFHSEFSETSLADWEKDLHKGERVLRKETGNLEGDRERGRARFVFTPGARERRRRSTSRVREEIARIGRREASHKRRSESRERYGRSSQRGVTLPNPSYYVQADRHYGGNHYRRVQSRAASVSSQTHHICHRCRVAWLSGQHDAPTTEIGNECCEHRHNYGRSIPQLTPSRVMPSNLVVVDRTHGTYPGITGRGSSRPRERIAKRDPYHEHPSQEPWRMRRNRSQNDDVIARSKTTVYTHNRRGHGKIIETFERITRMSRSEIPERVSHRMAETYGNRHSHF